MNRKLITGVCVAALALAVCLAAEPARATTQLQATITTNYFDGSHQITGVFGITDLVLPDGTAYNVSFIMTTDPTDIPPLAELLPPSDTPAEEAAAIDAALSSPYDEIYPRLQTQTYTNYNLYDPGLAIQTGWFSAWATPSDPPAVGGATLAGWSYTDQDNNVESTFYYPEMGPIALFTPCSVPEPNTSTLVLVGLGLICLIGLRRKFNGQTNIT